SNEYAASLASDGRSIAAEKDIIKFIFKKIILSLPIVDQAFEEKFLNWAIDKEVLKALIAKTLKNFSSEVPSMNQLASISPNWNEDREFALELLGSSIRYKTD